MPMASTDIPPLVGACVKGVTSEDGCSGGHDACVYGFTWVPQCVDNPLGPAISAPPCDSVKSCAALLPPAPVGACAKTNGCSGGHDACLYGFTWVPQCVDLPEFA